MLVLRLFICFVVISDGSSCDFREGARHWFHCRYTEQTRDEPHSQIRINNVYY